VLRVLEGFESLLSEFATEPGLLDAAERAGIVVRA
jgi:hypothetical protein